MTDKTLAQSISDAMASIGRLHQAPQREKRAMNAEITRLRGIARGEFARSHGIAIARHWFSLRMLRDGSWNSRSALSIGGDEDRCCSDSATLDHAEYYRDTVRPYRPAALVAHLYGPIEPARERAAHYGLRFEVLPWSWYYPESCTAVAYLRVNQ